MSALIRWLQGCSVVAGALLVLGGLSVACSADDAKPAAEQAAPPAKVLGIDDPAPPINVSEWSLGDPIEGLQPGQVYVVEFWATWCGPCLASMPHISQLQTQYGDQATFIGITREDAETVNGFLDQEQSPGKTWRELLKYRLALDAEGATNNAYMRAAEQSGIPTAFLVGRDGKLEWIGHPMGIDGPLAKVVAGEWDRAAAVAALKKEQIFKTLLRQLNSLARAQNWDGALAALDEAEVQQGPDPKLTTLRMAVLKLAGRREELAALESAYVQQIWNDSAELNNFAWQRAIGKGDRNLDLALKAAQRGVELTRQEDASILDTLARVHYELGQLDKAIEWQRLAVKVNRGANAEVDATLKLYEEAAASKAGDKPGDAAGEPDKKPE